MLKPKKKIFESKGYCPICENNVTFSAEQTWFRDFLICSQCGSIPRERALMQVIKTYYPNYHELKIHESSPGGRGTSVKLHKECKQYSASHFYSDIPCGTTHKSGFRCEDLENITFDGVRPKNNVNFVI